MRVKTWWFVVAVFLVVLPIGGCEASSKERLEWGRKVIAGAQELSAGVDREILAKQAELAAVVAQLADPNLGPAGAELAKQAEAIRAVIVDKLKYKATFDQTIAEMQAWMAAGAQGEPNLPEEIKVWAGVASIGGREIGKAVGGKTGAWIQLIAALAPILLGLFVKSSVQLKTTRTALKEVVAGGEEFKMEAKDLPPVEVPGEGEAKERVDVIKLWKDAQILEQSKATTKLVALAKAEYKAKMAALPETPTETKAA